MFCLSYHHYFTGGFLLGHKNVLLNLQVPTLLVWDRYARQLDNALLYDSRRRWVHPEQLAMWADFGWRFGSSSAASRRKYELAMGHLKRFLHNAHKRGVTIGLGTDTPFPHHVAGQ